MGTEGTLLRASIKKRQGYIRFEHRHEDEIIFLYWKILPMTIPKLGRVCREGAPEETV